MVKLFIENYDWSRKLFRSYDLAVNKSIEFCNDVNTSGKLDSCIYSGNGTRGEHCIVTLLFDKVRLCVNLNIECDHHRIDTNIKIPELKKECGNYYNYKNLVSKILEIKEKYKNKEELEKSLKWKYI